ncbi:MAG: murein biosynthesis integral membrane protein MurJ [Candidatus Levybacteria bacterium RIFCSPHIGHO2_01_FULL_37_33]|nr:MAG: murein biosynthesis integral membrane protein MurJ [Candidatus Levybacteria bacterium RIFCSPHIGHO2_01_FULL_37_33]OGH30125.1 MAG: murein biosynthesis integral membrane protein MurJ [Candidatus Levybacteria bacterium RIFCSPHIGHO2_12_FULL_37_12]OGH32378.1 MAG: murein biosynthesis integral membrane protein MurJ [Candidatus Levybacteria bacterium RIFCSPLOWO2_01_FULL_36_54]
MPKNFLRKSLNILLARQTNILSAAFIIMITIVLSQVLGLVRQRLLVSIFGASNILGVYFVSTRLPDFLFQLIIAGALSSALIPVFSDYLGKEKQEDAHKLGSTLLTLGLIGFTILATILFIFSLNFSKLIAPGFSHEQLLLMSNLMRIIIVGQLLFIIGSFFSAVLQSHNHFFIPGFALALYNLGIIIGILLLNSAVGIYSAAYGVILGAFIFVIVQIPLIRNVRFSLKPSFSFKDRGISQVLKLMWPRTLSIAIFQLGTLLTVTFVSFLQDPGRKYVIFDLAQTLAFAPVSLIGNAIAQAAFPVLSREKDKLDEFKATFITSFNQMLYLILPVSVLFLVLRIPLVRLIYGASRFDWPATVLTGRTLAFFSISIFAQSLIYLISRGFYALHDTKMPLIVGAATTALMIFLSWIFIFIYQMGIESIAFSFSIATIVNLLVSFILLDIKVGGFKRVEFIFSISKIFLATFFTGFALYVPIKLLDQLVFDTTRTVNLLMLTGISSLAGLSLYLFLTWLFDVKEASTFLLIFRKIGNWREILSKSEETLDATHIKV